MRLRGLSSLVYLCTAPLGARPPPALYCVSVACGPIRIDLFRYRSLEEWLGPVADWPCAQSVHLKWRASPSKTHNIIIYSNPFSSRADR